MGIIEEERCTDMIEFTKKRNARLLAYAESVGKVARGQDAEIEKQLTELRKCMELPQ